MNSKYTTKRGYSICYDDSLDAFFIIDECGEIMDRIKLIMPEDGFDGEESVYQSINEEDGSVEDTECILVPRDLLKFMTKSIGTIYLNKLNDYELFPSLPKNYKGESTSFKQG